MGVAQLMFEWTVVTHRVNALCRFQSATGTLAAASTIISVCESVLHVHATDDTA